MFHEDVIKWIHFLCYRPFGRGIHWSPVNSPHEGQWRWSLMFSVICAWINGWLNNKWGWWFETRRANYDVIVMLTIIFTVRTKVYFCHWIHGHMMTSSNGKIFRVTGPLCGEFTGPGEIPTQRPVTRNFDVFFDLHRNKRLSKQWWGWGFETQSCPLCRHRNVLAEKGMW